MGLTDRTLQAVLEDQPEFYLETITDEPLSVHLTTGVRARRLELTEEAMVLSGMVSAESGDHHEADRIYELVSNFMDFDQVHENGIFPVVDRAMATLHDTHRTTWRTTDGYSISYTDDEDCERVLPEVVHVYERIPYGTSVETEAELEEAVEAELGVPVSFD